MVLTTPPTLEDFDAFAPRLIDDPYPTYARLLVCEPFFHDQLQMWIMSRHADVRQILRDTGFGRSNFSERVKVIFGDGPLARSFCQWLLFRNPPDHTRLRALVSQAFSPRVVSLLGKQIQRMVDALLDRLLPLGTMDLIGDFAYPLPVLVISALLGVPNQDRAEFRSWSMALSQSLDALGDPLANVIAAGNAAAAHFTDYFAELVAVRRTQPGPDLLTSLIAVETNGDRLSTDELLATCVLLFFAGHETTVNLIGNGVLALLRHRDQMRRLQRDPALIANAVEEMLRFDAPVQRLSRVAERDLDVGGVHVRAGDRAFLMIGAANRDPRRFDQPELFNVARPDAGQHLTFGGGMHYCLGAPLARLEAQVAITTLLRRAPNLFLPQPESVVWRRGFVMRGLAELVVRTRDASD